MPFKDPVKRTTYSRMWARNKWNEEKAIALAMLGDRCVRCGISDPRVLEFDHIEPILRKEAGESGSNLSRAIATGRVDPDLFQLLCANCHTIKTLEEDMPKYRTFRAKKKILDNS